MKNIFYVFLLMPLFYLGAQDEGPYLIRLHVVEVEGNIGAFIQANREYYKPLAAKAPKDCPAEPLKFKTKKLSFKESYPYFLYK